MAGTIIAMLISMIALAVALRSQARSKRVKAAVYAQREWLEQQFHELRGEWLRHRDELQQQKSTEDMAIDCARIETIERRQRDCEHKVEHLFGETQNLATLPGCHPTREELTSELHPRLQPIMDRLAAVLFPNQIALDEYDWMYRLKQRKFPYSLTFEEGLVVHFLVAANELQSG